LLVGGFVYPVEYVGGQHGDCDDQGMEDHAPDQRCRDTGTADDQCSW
jgi:hypothetical protein